MGPVRELFSARLVRSLDELADLRSAWSDLATAASGSPFSTPWWAETWWQHMGRGRLAVAVVEEANGLAALAPLHERHTCGLIVTRFLGHGMGAVNELLVRAEREEAAEAVWRLLLGDRRRVLELVEYAEPRLGLRALENVDAAVRVAPSNVCPVIELGGDAASYVETRGKSLRRTLLTARRRLDDTGRSFDVVCIRDAATLATVLPKLAEVEMRAQSNRNRRLFINGSSADFTSSLLHAAARAGALRLFVGRLEGRAITYDVGFVVGRRLSLWIGGFDPEWRGIAPGHLALAEIVEQARADGVEELDLLLGDDAYKHRWSTTAYKTVHVTAGRSRGLLGVGRGIVGMRRVSGRTARLVGEATRGRL